MPSKMSNKKQIFHFVNENYDMQETVHNTTVNIRGLLVVIYFTETFKDPVLKI